MMKYVLYLIAVFAVVKGNDSGGRDHFVAAVLEAHLVHDPSSQDPDEIIRSNLKTYSRAAEEAAKHGTDIIVFPELGLYPPDKREILKKFMEEIPDPLQDKYNPCVQTDRFKNNRILKALSCMAQKYKMYVVANLGDIQPCSHDQQSCDADNLNCTFSACREDGVFMFNTAVAFNREGDLISRYHKNHLYFEPPHDLPPTLEYAAFDTEFGKFGIIICFDILFEPVINLIRNHNIETILFPTYWYDDVAPFSAVELQQSFALMNDVNFLASNMHIPKSGTLGSGIYSKQYGAQVYTSNPDGKIKLLISTISRRDQDSKRKDYHKRSKDDSKLFIIANDNVEIVDKEKGDAFPLNHYESLVGPTEDKNSYRTMKSQTSHHGLTKLFTPKGQIRSCHNGLCCSLNYEADSMAEDYYLTVYNGTNDVKGFFKWEEETCLLVRCDSFEGKDCITQPTLSKTVFHSIELKATFTTDFVYPAVSKSRLRLAPKSEWDVHKSDKTFVLKFRSSTKDPLLKAGLLGRCYSRDPPYVKFTKP